MGCTRSTLLNELKQLRDLKRQRHCDSLDVDEANVTASSLDVAQIGAMYAGPVREILLRQPQGFRSALYGKPANVVQLGWALVCRRLREAWGVGMEFVDAHAVDHFDLFRATFFEDDHVLRAGDETVHGDLVLSESGLADVQVSPVVIAAVGIRQGTA